MSADWNHPNMPDPVAIRDDDIGRLIDRIVDLEAEISRLKLVLREVGDGAKALREKTTGGPATHSWLESVEKLCATMWNA